MKNSELKIIAIILCVAIVFTVLASNAVSVASIIFMTKNDIAGTSSTATQTDGGTATTPGGSTSTTPGGSTSTTPGGSTSTTPDASTGSTGGTSTTPDASTGSTGSTGGTSTTPDADKGSASTDDKTSTSATKTDKEVLEIYTNLMNKAKADKPGFKKVEYQELPSDANSRVISKGSGLVGTLLDLVDTLGIMTDKATAEAEPDVVEKGGDMRWFPVYKCEKGCYLTDTSAIKETKYEDLGNGKARITIVLKDEDNPEPMAEGASTSPSKTGAMFSPLSKADIDETINGGVVKAVIVGVTYSLTYHDCTAIVEYDTKTNQIIKLEQYMDVAIQGGGKIFGISEIKIDKQELLNTMVIYDLEY